MVLMETFSEILQRPTIGAVFMEVMIFLSPVWIAFLVGVLVGWVWKPRWANSRNNGKFDCSSPTSIISSPVKGFGSMQSLNSSKVPKPSCMDSGVDKHQILFPSSTENTNCSSSSSHLKNEEPVTVVEDDLDYLYHLVERTDGGPPWKHMMDRSVPNMNYQAWHRDPETGPPQYCTRTIYEDATPELLRDFFWDDVSRLKWDDMLVHSETMEECPTTGTMVVHWIRKFPFLCSDREYIIGRRIWESGRSYYCITKGVPRPSVPRRDKPRRVDLFYSSWFIQAVESRKEHGQLTACEVILFHHEDMGIPREIAKFGIRQGMWGTVKKIERGLRDYQKARASGGQISRHAFMAQISTKINPDYMKSLENAEESSETQVQVQVLDLSEKPTGMNIPKLLLFGGAVVLVCSIDRGLLTKTLIFGIARRFANAGRRL